MSRTTRSARAPLRTLAGLLLLAVTTPALAQTNVDPVNKFAWSENCGWLNFADAGTPPGTQGAFFNVAAGFASGFVWAENTGWINLGNGAGPYLNTTGLNFGVNINSSTGALTGMAWAENVGWINFSGGAMATPPDPALLDLTAGRLRGYAWGENIGWINLDHAVHFVGIDLSATCDGDVNCDFALDGFDVEVQEKAVGGDMTDYCLANPDFNGDFALDGFDVEAVELVVGGGPCP